MREVYEFVKSVEDEVKIRLGTPKLTVELVPQSCWFSNVRKHASSTQWDTLRKATYTHYKHICAVCGGKGPKWPVECHEIWTYSILPKGNIQKLQYLIALCPSCHEVKHFGRAQLTGRGDNAFQHLASVNQWTKGKTRWYLDQVHEIWDARSDIVDWELDLSWVKNRFGMEFEISSPPRGGISSSVEYAPEYGTHINVIRIK